MKGKGILTVTGRFVPNSCSRLEDYKLDEVGKLEVMNEEVMQ